MKANRSAVAAPFGVVPVPHVIPSGAEQSDMKVATGRSDSGGCSRYQRGIPTGIASTAWWLAMAGTGTPELTLTPPQGE